MNSALYENYLSILKHELVPALGCTEPIAIAYASAKAVQVLGEFPRSIEMRCSGNIIKNVKGVTVPNSGGMKGIDVAAVLGAVGGNPDQALEVLKNVTQKDIDRTKELLEQKICSCSLEENVANLYIRARAAKGNHYAEVTIVNHHTNITKIEKDGEILLENPVKEEEASPEIDKSRLTVKNILDFADQVKISDVEEVLERQIQMNSAIAQEGLDNNYGAQIGKTLMHTWGKGVITRACAKAAAGSDARMGGCSMPVVINSGSGTVSIAPDKYTIRMILEARLIQDSFLLAERQHVGVDAALAQIGSSSVVVLIWLRQPEFLCRFLLGRGWGRFYRLERRTDTALYPIDFPHRFYKRNAFNLYEIVQRGAAGSFRFEVRPRTILCKGQRTVPFVAELSGSFRFEVVRLAQLHILVQIHLLRLGDFLLCYTGHTLPPILFS